MQHLLVYDQSFQKMITVHWLKNIQFKGPNRWNNNSLYNWNQICKYIHKYWLKIMSSLYHLDKMMNLDEWLIASDTEDHTHSCLKHQCDPRYTHHSVFFIMWAFTLNPVSIWLWLIRLWWNLKDYIHRSEALLLMWIHF